MAQHQPVEQCQCNGCTGLPTVRDGLLDYISALDIEQPEEIAIASQVLDGLDNLHTSIRMRHEAVRVNATNGGVINGQPPVSSRADSVVNARSGDTMICDHCALHSLECVGSPICTNCCRATQPCVRRWCISKGGLAGSCIDPNCHYAHADCLPVDAAQLTIEDYIILPGSLPNPIGPGGSKAEFKDPMSCASASPTTEEVKARQVEGRAKLFEWSGGDHDKVRQLYFPCNQMCSGVAAVSKVPTADVQKLQALAIKLKGRR